VIHLGLVILGIAARCVDHQPAIAYTRLPRQLQTAASTKNLAKSQVFV
jgi:hypothetical protein